MKDVSWAEKRVIIDKINAIISLFLMYAIMRYISIREVIIKFVIFASYGVGKNNTFSGSL